MGNIIACKAFQAKYKDCASALKLQGISIYQGESVEDRTFADMENRFKAARIASIVFVDGITLLNEKGISQIGLNKTDVAVSFESAAVGRLNSKVEEVLKIAEINNDYRVRLSWINSTADDDVSEYGDYYTTSVSRGKTTQGQGAVDFLTAAALFGEALRNLLFDRVKNKISLIVLERFISYRKFLLLHERRIMNDSLTELEVRNLYNLIMKLSDALYMSGAYYKSDSIFVKRHMETKVLFGFKASQPVDEVLGSEIYNPEHLEKLLKAYA